MSRRSRELLAGCAVIVLFALPLLPEILGSRRLIFRDAQVTHWPWSRAALEMLGRGEVPFIDPHASGGEPLLANPNAVLLYPTFLLERALPPASAFNLHYLLHVIWAFFGARALARRLRLSDGAAFFSGVAFAFSGMMLSYGSAFRNSSAAAAWLPWCAAAALDLARAAGRRRAARALAAVGIAFGIQLLAGEPAISVLTAIFAGCLAAGAAAAGPVEPRGRALARLGLGLAASAALAVAIASPLLLPLRQVLPLTFRGQHLYSREAFGAVPLRPERLLEWLFPRLRGDPGIVGMEPRPLQGASSPVYIWCVCLGVVPLLVFSAAALRRQFWDRRAFALAAAAAVTFLLSFGFLLPFYGVLFAFAPLRRLRYPIKFYLLTSLCVALLAGLGVESLRRRGPGRREALVFACALAAFAAAWALSGPGGPVLLAIRERTAASYAPFADALRAGVRADALAGLISVAFAGLVLRWRPASTGAGYVLGFVTLSAALIWGLPLFVSGPAAELSRVPALARVVAGWGRLYSPDAPTIPLRVLEPDFPLRLPRVAKFARFQIEHLFPATGEPFGVRYLFEGDPDGSYGYYNRAVSEAARASTPIARDHLLRLFGARFVLAPEGAAYPLFEAQTGLSIGAQRMTLFEDPTPLPELRWTSRVHRRSSLSGTIDLIRSDAFAPSSDIALPGPRDEGPSGPGSTGSVRAATIDAARARAQTDAHGAGYLLFSRTFFPAWKARIDGSPAPVVVGNARDLAVAVPAGRHEVVFEYDRAPFRLGVALQAAAVLAAALVTAGASGRGGRGARPDARRYPAGTR